MAELTKAEKVRKAADHLERFGWIQGKFADSWNHEPAEGEACCASGALWVTTSYDEGYLLTRDFAEYLGLGRWTYGVYGWNDKEGRTADEVIAALRAWADSLETGAQSE